MIHSIYGLPPDLGQTLAELRNATDKTQADIAGKLNIDQSRVSRIEKGSVTPTESEIEAYLSAIGTEDAKAYRDFLKLQWVHLNPPSFWHPQRNELCKAETSLQKLENFKSQPKVSKQQINEAELYSDTLLRSAKYLSDLNHSIAFIGKNGVGKTTAVSKLTGLFNAQEPKFHRQSLLSTNISKTTACEVRIRRGKKFGLIVHPHSEDEINKVIEDFWAVWKNSTEEERENQKTDVSWEVERALNNMIKSLQDNVESEDPLEELVNQCENLDTFRVEIFDRLKLSERTRCEFWFEATSEQANREELKKKFRDINYSLDKELPLPQQIDVIVPDNVFQSSPYELDIVDTRGVAVEGRVKETVIRQDLIKYLDDPQTLTVLCCKFGDAPGEVIYSFIDSLIQSREKAFKERVIILVLAHDKDALKTTDNVGEEIDTEDDAYKLEQNKVQRKLKKLQQKSSEAINIPILVFNASSDDSVNDPVKTTTALIEQLEKLRSSHVRQILEAADALDLLIKDVEEKNAREAHQKVIKSLKGFLDAYPELPSHSWLVHEHLLKEMKKAHQRQVLATTRRRGASPSLNVYVLLGNGARNVAWNHTNKVFYELIGIINEKLRDSELKPAHNFLKQISANWSVWREDFLKYAEQTGKQVFQFQLEYYFSWAECAAMYGHGGKFRDEVIYKLERWFNASEQQHLHDLLNNRIEKAWQETVLAQLRNLTDESTEAD
jgi:transcriptional regulator with XRE-family HTH domain